MIQVSENLIKPLLITQMRSGKTDCDELLDKYANMGMESMQRLAKYGMKE